MLLDVEFHAFAGEEAVGESGLAELLHVEEEFVVVVGVVVGEDETFDAGEFGELHGLVVTAVAPAAVGGEFVGGELGVVDEEVGTAGEFDELGVDGFLMLDIGADDEDFSLPLDAEAVGVAWSVASGPLTGISTGGLATADVVYQNTAATAQGSFAGDTDTLGLTVVDTLPDNFGTYAGDELVDAWQVQYFGLNNPNAAPLIDADSDGFDNLFEYNAGIIPTDPLSTFHWSTEPVPGFPLERRLIFSPRYAGHTYTVKTSTDLDSNSWISLAGATTTDAGDVRTVLDPNADGERRFYRVEISKP